MYIENEEYQECPEHGDFPIEYFECPACSEVDMAIDRLLEENDAKLQHEMEILTNE